MTMVAMKTKIKTKTRQRQKTKTKTTSLLCTILRSTLFCIVFFIDFNNCSILPCVVLYHLSQKILWHTSADLIQLRTYKYICFNFQMCFFPNFSIHFFELPIVLKSSLTTTSVADCGTRRLYCLTIENTLLEYWSLSKCPNWWIYLSKCHDLVSYFCCSHCIVQVIWFIYPNVKYICFNYPIYLSKLLHIFV